MSLSQLPEDLQKEALTLLGKIRAREHPDVLSSHKDIPSVTMLAMITIGLFIGAYIITEIANYNEIKANWAHYQCMPSVAPFASFYGHDLNETMQFCIAQSVKDHAPGVINPIYKGISEVTDVVDGVYDKVVAIEGGVAGLLKGFESFVINFVNSFRLLGTRVRMSFIRIKEIFGRVYGLFMAFVYAGISALTFGENLACNPLVAFMATITGHEEMCCFAPTTRIPLADGSVVAIRDVQIGDVLAGGGLVTSTYLFTGIHTPMVRFHGIEVSTDHYVRAGNRLIQARDHPGAIPVFRLPYLYCITTSDHRIPVISDLADRILEFADYEESSDPAVIAEAQRIAEMTLNANMTLEANNAHVGPTVPDYSLGLDPTLLVYMRNGSWIPLEHVKVGAQLMSGAFVVGVIQELCETLCEIPGSTAVVSAAQLIWQGGVWRRAAHIWSCGGKVLDPAVLTHLLTDSDAPITVRTNSETLNVRDYAECYGIQTPYDTKLKATVLT